MKQSVFISKSTFAIIKFEREAAMLKINQRQSEIYQYIKKNESAHVQELLSIFPVSPPTLRKDLACLEDAGLIIRTHGAARIASNEVTMTPFEARSSLHKSAKEAIARKAVTLIENNDSIILDSGTTTLELAKLLVDRQNLTVFTNSLPIAMTFSNSPVNVTVIGGILLGKNLSLEGPDAEAFFQRIEVNKTFISSSGVRPQSGLVNSSSIEASIKKSMMDAGDQVYAVLDSAKFSTPSIYPTGTWADLDYIITESPIDNPEILEQLALANIRIILAE